MQGCEHEVAHWGGSNHVDALPSFVDTALLPEELCRDFMPLLIAYNFPFSCSTGVPKISSESLVDCAA